MSILMREISHFGLEEFVTDTALMGAVTVEQLRSIRVYSSQVAPARKRSVSTLTDHGLDLNDDLSRIRGLSR